LYLVSNSGAVYSTFKGKLRRKATMKHSGGYLQVHLSTLRGPRIVKVHELVAELFLPPKPEGCYLIRHWDDDPENNDHRNLLWGTQVENQADAKRNGRQSGRPRVISDEVVFAIREERGRGVPGVVVAAKYGVSQQTVCDIHKGRKRRG
jgi:hypothetical protein